MNIPDEVREAIIRCSDQAKRERDDGFAQYDLSPEWILLRTWLDNQPKAPEPVAHDATQTTEGGVMEIPGKVLLNLQAMDGRIRWMHEWLESQPVAPVPGILEIEPLPLEQTITIYDDESWTQEDFDRMNPKGSLIPDDIKRTIEQVLYGWLNYEMPIMDETQVRKALVWLEMQPTEEEK